MDGADAALNGLATHLNALKTIILVNSMSKQEKSPTNME